jgi:hypothetical protein
MMYIFIWYIFGMVDVDIFIKKLGQSWHRLTLKKYYMHYIMAKREYITTIHTVLRNCAFERLEY